MKLLLKPESRAKLALLCSMLVFGTIGIFRRYIPLPSGAVALCRAAIGMITLSPAETAIIAADIATKESAAEIGFVDRFSGTLIITGSISDVEAAFRATMDYCEEKLGFSVCQLTKT